MNNQSLKKLLHALLGGLLILAATIARAEEPKVTQIPASPAFIELLKSWDPQIWFFTPLDKPLRSLDGLKRESVACWGMEHFQRMQDLFRVLNLPGDGVKVMGDGAYNDTPDRPLLYVTWAKYAPNLKNVLRIQFISAEPAKEVKEPVK
ncbi:MAG: hypothetical protein PSU94_17265 [Lacunisphaera sp.]|nr:hypothetical protein [Lacunisphaera sp.]